MSDKHNILCTALENIDTTYIEESLDYAPQPRHKTARLPKLSAACAALLLLAGLSATAFALSRIPLSWRDIFSPRQTVIGDADEAPVVSRQNANLEDLEINVQSAISDERTLYLLYSIKSNEGATLDPKGQFANFELLFPDKTMSGAYQQYFISRREGVPENELEGVIYADWQPENGAERLALTFTDWQEKQPFDDVTIDVDIAEMVSNSGENAQLPALFTGREVPQYLWQPSDAGIPLPYGGVSLCNAGWSDGVLQLVMKGSLDAGEWATGQNWYFIDTRTGDVIYPELSAEYLRADKLDNDLAGSDWQYFWNFVTIDKEALPYLEMHWGGKDSLATVLPGKWTVEVMQTPVSVESHLLAENVVLTYAGETLLAEKIECSKLSMAVYFADYIDSTTGILGAFELFDVNGDMIPCDWGFTADQTDDSCMIWTRFKEPIDPETIGRLVVDGEVVFTK